jgi:hypothetical protein
MSGISLRPVINGNRELLAIPLEEQPRTKEKL